MLYCGMLCKVYTRCSRTQIFEKSCSFVSSVYRLGVAWCFWQIETRLCVLLVGSGLNLQLVQDATFVQINYYCSIMNPNWDRWGLSSLHVCLGSFVTSWMNSWSAPGGILVGGRLITVQVSSTCKMTVIMVHWVPETLKP